MKVKDYKELLIWQKGIDVVDRIYRISKGFPQDELYGLSAQMRRSAVLIPSNIAEGFVRQHTKEYAQFLYISLGSCAELETQIIVGHRQNYLTREDHDGLLEAINHEIRMIRSLIKKL